MAWRPMGAAADFNNTLHEGVPVWMAEELHDWMLTHLQSELRFDLARRFDSESRNTAPILASVRTGFRTLLRDHGGDTVIAFLDYVIYMHGLWADESGMDDEEEQRLVSLTWLLERCGSAWKLGSRDGNWGLERRVPEGVQEAADHTVTSTGSAGALLAEAWHHAFGLNPDPEEAYEKAIKAVEEAGARVVLPKNPKATLGTMIATMRPHGDWALEVTDNSADYFSDVVLNMCEALWQGQPSRHGGNGYRKPTQGEAEAAVMLAVPLVQWFQSGAVKRRP